MHHPTDRITHTTAFVTPVVEHWLEREIAQWVRPTKDRSDDPSHHERTLYLWATSRSSIVRFPKANICFLASFTWLRADVRWYRRTTCLSVGSMSSIGFICGQLQNSIIWHWQTFLKENVDEITCFVVNEWAKIQWKNSLAVWIVPYCFSLTPTSLDSIEDN